MLEKAVDGYVRMEDFLYNPGFYAYGSGWEYPLKKAALTKAIKRLRENGLIDFVDDKTLMFRLTDSGKDRALWIKIKEEEEKWDGRWRMVVFDVPEKYRIGRDALRRALKQIGFLEYQKSVFIHPFECKDEIDFVVEFFRMRPWARIVVAESIDDDLRLKRHFNL